MDGIGKPSCVLSSYHFSPGYKKCFLYNKPLVTAGGRFNNDFHHGNLQRANQRPSKRDSDERTEKA